MTKTKKKPRLTLARQLRLLGASFGGLVPECAEQGTEPGQWSYGVLAMEPESSFEQKMSREVSSWPEWKRKAAAAAFCSPDAGKKAEPETPEPERGAVPTDAEIEAAIQRVANRDHEVQQAKQELRDVIARRLSAVERERDEARAEVAAFRSYIESKHNAYGATGIELGMKIPATHLDALKQLVEESESLASMELREARAEVERLRAAAKAAAPAQETP